MKGELIMSILMTVLATVALIGIIGEKDIKSKKCCVIAFIASVVGAIIFKII